MSESNINSNKQLKRFYRQSLSEIESDNSPTCKYFGECGGCSLQNLSPEAQIQLKTEALKRIISPIWNQDFEIAASPDDFNYRFRMDYVTISHPIHAPHHRLGLRKKGNFSFVVDLHECHLIPSEWFARVRQLYEFIHGLGIENYDLVKHTGELRYMVIRSFGNQAMLNIVTRSKFSAELIDQMSSQAEALGFTSLNWLLNEGVGDVSEGRIYHTSLNPDIEVAMNVEGDEYKFKVGAHTFFQNNVKGFEQMMEYVSSVISEDESDATLIDLYSGVGTIGIMLANRFKKVVGVEINPDSVIAAKQNVKLNNMQNITYYSGDAADFSSIHSEDLEDSFLVVDPPRTGLGAKGVEQVLSILPRKIIYISCNPITQVQDILGGLSDKYGVKSVKGFDMFPQTLHLENVIVLERI